MTPTITLPRATVEQALEALESLFNWKVDHERGKRCGDAVIALRAALAQQAESPCACWPGRMCSRQAQCAADVRAQQAEPVDADAAYQRWLADTHAPALRRMDSQGAFSAGWQAALAQQAEPVAWVECNGDLVWNNREAAIGRNLYTAPPQRQPLTDEDIERIFMTYQSPRQAARAVERAHNITDPQIEDRLARHGIPMPEGDPKC